MADWPLNPSGSTITTTDNNSHVSTTSGTNTKGSWTQVIASTPYPTSAILFHFVSGFTGDNLVDIGIGASGSETVLIPNIPYPCLARRNNETLFIPVSIPRNSRISIRGAYTGASTASCTMDIKLLSGNFMFQPLTQFDSYGAEVSTSSGVAIDPGAVADTKGSWTEIVSSCNLINSLAIGITGLKLSRTTCYWSLDLALGAIGNETIILPNFILSTNSDTDHLQPALFGFFPFHIAAGSRVSARASCTTTSDRLFDIILLGGR